MKGSWRAAEARHCEGPGKAIGEGTVSVTFEDPGLKRPCKEVEAWYHEESLLMKSSCTSELEISVLWNDHKNTAAVAWSKP